MTATIVQFRQDYRDVILKSKSLFNVLFTIGLSIAIYFIVLNSTRCPRSNYDITTSARAFAPPSDWKTNPIHAVYVDTPAPVKTYWYVMRVEPQVWNTTVDTLNLVLNQIGKAKTVDEADAIRNIAYRVLGRLGSRITLDSTINKPKK